MAQHIYTSIAKRIIETQDKRSSQEAKELLADRMEAHGYELAQEARKYADYADRKTIQKEDILEAINELEN